MSAWDPVGSPFDSGKGNRGCWSPDLALFAVAGFDPALTNAIITSPDGAVWTARGNPFTSGSGLAWDIVWAAGLGLFVAVGYGAAGDAIATSPDGITWTGRGAPFGTFTALTAVAWSEAQALLVAGAGGSSVIATSPDGITWTARSTPFDGGGYVGGIAYSPALDLWVAVGNNGADDKCVMTSPDGITWTAQTTPIDGDAATGTSVIWADGHAAFYATSFGTSFLLPRVLRSEDGTTWAGEATPADAVTAEVDGIIETPAAMFLGTYSADSPPPLPFEICRSDDGGSTWFLDEEPNPFGDGGGWCTGFVYSPDLDVTLAVGRGHSGVVEALMVAVPFVPPPPIGSWYAAVGGGSANIAAILNVQSDGTVAPDFNLPAIGSQGVAASPDGTMLAVANLDADSVTIFLLADDSVLALIPVGVGPFDVAWAPDSSVVAVTNQFAGTVSIIEISSLTVIHTVTVGTAPKGVRFAPDGSYFAVANHDDDTVQTVSTSTWTTIATGTVGSGPNGLDIASDGSFIAVACRVGATGSIDILDPIALTVSHSVDPGGGYAPTWVSIDPALAFVVSCNVDISSLGNVTVIETAGWTVTNTTPVGSFPVSVQTAPDSSFVAVVSAGTADVWIVRTSNWAVASFLAVGTEGENQPGGIDIFRPAPAPASPNPKSLKNTWRWVVVGLDGAVKSFLDKLATSVHVTYILDDAAVMTCDLPSDNFEVYQVANDGSPRTDYGLRVLYGLRREEPGNGQPPWVCRFAGLISILQDQAISDEPITHLTAHDPWQWARTLPVLAADGSLPGQNGLTYTNQTGAFIARDLIANAYAWIVAAFGDPLPWSEQGDGLHLANDGQHNFIDIDSGFFDGSSAVIPSINFPQGCSVGDAWTQLVQTGNVDIVLAPVYGRRGILCVMNVYAQAGKNRPGAVFGWDMFPRNLVGVDHLQDGTLIENWGQFFAGNLAVHPAKNSDSIDKYGPYFVQKNYPAGSNAAAVSLLAQAELELRKAGKKTLTVSPTPVLAPDPFTQYGLGDVVPVWAGRPMPPAGIPTGVAAGSALRGAIRSQELGANRVYGFEIDLSDDLQETVANILLTDPNEQL